MSNTENIIGMVKEQGIIPLFYHEDAFVSIEVVNALYNAGVRIVEYTNRGAKALENFKMLLATRDKQWPGLLLSVGTIKTVESAQQFIHAGADFIICPGVIPAVAIASHEAGLLWVPGCMTPTEIMIAEQHGAKLVKLFPGNLLGPSFVSAVKELFPGLLFMPTGGVDVSEENIGAWFKAGVCAVGLGSKVISKDILEQKDYQSVTKLAEKALQIVQSVKKIY